MMCKPSDVARQVVMGFICEICGWSLEGDATLHPRRCTECGGGTPRASYYEEDTDLDEWEEHDDDVEEDDDEDFEWDDDWDEFEDEDEEV